MTRADWTLPPVTLEDGTKIPGYLHARMEHNRLNPPAPWTPPARSEDECIECGAEVPSEFEPDPDPDGSGGTLILESSCPMCGVALCEECARADDDGYCTACSAEAEGDKVDAGYEEVKGRMEDGTWPA